MSRRQRSALFVAPSAFHLSGLATWLDYLDPGLTGLGWKVTIGLVQGPRHHSPEGYLRTHPHPRWHAIACGTGTPEGRALAVQRAVDAVQPDVVATVNIPDAVVGAARVRARHGAGPRTVVTLHGIQPDLYDDLRTLGPWVDRVLCTNRLSCALAQARGGMTPGKIGYAPYGVRCPARLPGVGTGQRLRIAFVGRLEQDQKRVHDLPGILRTLQGLGTPFELRVAGTGPEQASLQGALEREGLAGCVQFLGFVPPDEVKAQVLERADVLLLTSTWETGPLVVWEAMAAGVAVVSSRYLGSGAEAGLAHDGNALLFDPGDVDEAARQLHRIWSDAALRERVRQGGHALVAGRYSFEASVARWHAELSALCDAPPAAPRPPMPPVRAYGRLDDLLGAHAGETVRALLRRPAPDGGPGGEWPHTHAATPYAEPSFWSLAAELDRRPAEGAPA